VSGAIIQYLRTERPLSGQAADYNGLAEAGDLRDNCDVFSTEDDDAREHMMAMGRQVVFRRVMGSTAVALASRPEDAVLRMQIFSVLRQAFGALDEREERLIELRYWQDKTWEEVGDALGVDKRQALRIDAQMRKRLEKDLRKRGVDAPPPSGP
jgi:RNA polymerase sigma factor for flagellar operon FliA